MPDTPPSELKLDDLIDHDLLQGMVAAASEAWGVRFTVFRADGSAWPRAPGKDWFCREMRPNHPELTKRCQKSDKDLVDLLVGGERSVIGPCWLGLWEIAAPIAPEGRGVIGALMVGGIRDTETTAEQVLDRLVLSKVYYEPNVRTWYLGVCLPDLPSSCRRRSAPI